MPIRPENLDRYPPKPERERIRAAILLRAGNHCKCSPAYPNCRAVNRMPHPVTGSEVVLTIAHLDHQPENNDPANLRSWRQRCHDKYDAEHRLETRRRRAASNQFQQRER